MDAERARELLAQERARVENAIAALSRDGADDAAGESVPGERDSEGLFEKELDTGLGEDLAAQLSAVERAEQRLVEGTYGLSVESGEPIPDGRLEALPTAERTVEEQRALDS